jgi:hypothetical protein
LQQLLDKYRALHFDIVTINTLTDQETGAVKIMSDYGFTALKNPGEGWSWTSKTYGVKGTPTSFLLDPEGKILFKFNGVESIDAEETCDKEIGGLLAFSAATTPSPAHLAQKAQQ